MKLENVFPIVSIAASLLIIAAVFIDMNSTPVVHGTLTEFANNH